MTTPNLRFRPSHSGAAFAAALVTSFALFSPMAEAAITVIGNSTFYQSGAGSDSQSHTLSYNPGATSTAIVVSVVMESNGAPSAVTFGGATMTPVVAASGSNVGIYYLNNPTTGSASDLTFNYSSVGTVNFIAFQAVSLNTSDLIEATATATDTDTGLTLAVPSSDSFVMAGFNFNQGAGGTTTSADSPLTALFGDYINSGGGGFGYAENVASGNQNYSFAFNAASGSSARRITAASFNVVPEPSAAALLGFGVIGLLMRRRRS